MRFPALFPRYAAITFLVSLALSFGFGAYASRLVMPDAHSEAIRTGVESLGETRHVSLTLPDFTELVAEQGPAVVNISVSAKVKTALSDFGFPGMDQNDPFYQFFRRFQPPAPQGDVTRRVLGSGFIISKDGYILTNAHVVDDADEVTVKLTDKREFKAKVKGVDKPTDVAVLKIDASNLPTVKIGNPQQAKVGEWVVAIGSPFGFENSVTAGIISAKSRSLPDEGYVPFLQTDVAVNPGNSGGPLFDTSGEVIGINSQIYSQSGGYQGLSFAIPIDVAMNVEKQLVDHGKVSRGRLGVTIQEVNQQLADTFGLDKPQGALVGSVEKGSPAEKAGIETGDIILKFNGKDVARSSDLPPLVASLEPGIRVTLGIWRKGSNKDIEVRVGELKSVASNAKEDGGHSGSTLGMVVRQLTPEERRSADTAGLVVEDVDGSGPAAHAGIQPGDIIINVNGEAVSSGAKLKSLVESHKKHVALLIQRNGQKMFVPVDVA